MNAFLRFIRNGIRNSSVYRSIFLLLLGILLITSEDAARYFGFFLSESSLSRLHIIGWMLVSFSLLNLAFFESAIPDNKFRDKTDKKSQDTTKNS